MDAQKELTGHKEITYGQEVLRKGIHLFSLSIPVIYYYLSMDTAFIILSMISIFAVTMNIFARYSLGLHKLILRFFGGMLRPHEISGKYVLNGASWVLISASLCILIFPKIVMISSFVILIISDIAAALVGRKYGRIKYWDKSLEGSLAFVVTALTAITIMGNLFQANWLYFATGYIASVFGAAVEAVSKKIEIDDNLSIPVVIGIVMWLGGYYAASIGLPFLELLH